MSLSAPVSAAPGERLEVPWTIGNVGYRPAPVAIQATLGYRGQPAVLELPIHDHRMTVGDSIEGVLELPLGPGAAGGSLEALVEALAEDDANPADNRATAAIEVLAPACDIDPFEEDDSSDHATPIAAGEEHVRAMCTDNVDWLELEGDPDRVYVVAAAWLDPARGPGGLRVVVYEAGRGAKISFADPSLGSLFYSPDGPVHLRVSATRPVDLGSGSSYVVRADPLAPDLSAEVEPDATAVTAGEVLQLTDRVRNESYTAAPATEVAYYLSSDFAADPREIEVGRRPLPELDVWVVSSEQVGVTIPAGLTGDFDLIAIVDPDGAVVELDEQNNTSTPARISVNPTP